jgi:hypothetical protein
MPTATSIVFNNTVTGTTYDCRVIPLTNHRAFMEMPPFGKADGKNPLDGNQIPAGQLGAGYPMFPSYTEPKADPGSFG